MQGKKYIEKDADNWFCRNKTITHNCFTEYLLQTFKKEDLLSFDVAEFGIGRCNNINILSHYVNTIDGYDGSPKSIEKVNQLKNFCQNVDGKLVNLGATFEGIKKYDLIIFGFFTYMITDEEFDILIENSKKLLKRNGYIFIYDYLALENHYKADTYNKNLNVFKRNISFYLEKLSDFIFIDYRLLDNRKLQKYMIENPIFIDNLLEADDYNWTFLSLFKISKGDKHDN